MKKKITAALLSGVLALSIGGCGSKEMPESSHTEEGTAAQVQSTEEGPAKAAQSEAEEQGSEAAESEAEGTFSFADFENVQFCFSSGAGGWATMLTIDADGRFSGEWFDGELGLTGEGYPNGTMYQSDFTGQFTQPVQVNAYTYSVQIQELNYEEEVGREEIRDGVLYCYGTAYGLDEAEDILIYLPGAPLAELPEEFRSWVGYYDLSQTEDTELSFYGLYNETPQCGFSSYNMVDDLKANIARTEEQAAALENLIQNDSLTQVEYNEKTGELYELWDSALNYLWDALRQTKDAETMRDLIAEEREWIAWKEQETAAAGAAYEGGSMQEMAANQKAAELTKARVYELLELLD